MFVLLVSCSKEVNVGMKANLSPDYIKENREILKENSEKIERLLGMKRFQKNIEFQKRVEKARKTHMDATHKLNELVESQSLENKREYEQELANYRTIWDYIVHNYSI